MKRYIYVKDESLSSYSEADMINYSLLCNKYRSSFKRNIPNEWVLGERDRPMYRHVFPYDRWSAETYLEGLHFPNEPMHYCAKNILSEIFSLFHSLSKLRFSSQREGSLEGMFFAELVYWITNVLPRIAFDLENEAFLELNAMSSYFEYFYSYIFITNRSQREDLIIRALSLINTQIASLHTHANQFTHELSFTKSLSEQCDALTGLWLSSLNLLFLMIKRPPKETDMLNISAFLNTTCITPELAITKQSTLGHYLERALVLQGAFESGLQPVLQKPLLSLDSLLSQLNDAFYGAQEDINLEQSGIWPVLMLRVKHRNERQQRMRQILSDTADIHRSAMRLAYFLNVFHMILDSKPVYGQRWIYSNQIGEAFFQLFCSAMKDITDELKSRVTQLYNQIYKEYDTGRTDGKIQFLGPDELFYSLLRMEFSRFTSRHEKTSKILILSRYNIFSKRLQDQSLIDFFLLNTLIENTLKFKNTSEYRLLQTALSSRTNPPALMPKNTSAAQSQVLQLKKYYLEKTALPSYHVAEYLLAPILSTDSNTDELSPSIKTKLDTISKDKPRKKPNPFRSPLHQDIYNHFIQGMNIWVNYLNKLHWFIGLSSEKNKRMIALYQAVNQLMNYLYDPYREQAEPPHDFWENMLIDQLLAEAMTYYKEQCSHPFFSSSRWASASTRPMLQRQSDESGAILILKVNPVVEGAFVGTYNRLAQELVDAKAELARLKNPQEAQASIPEVAPAVQRTLQPGIFALPERQGCGGAAAAAELLSNLVYAH